MKIAFSNLYRWIDFVFQAIKTTYEKVALNGVETIAEYHKILTRNDFACQQTLPEPVLVFLTSHQYIAKNRK